MRCGVWKPTKQNYWQLKKKKVKFTVAISEILLPQLCKRWGDLLRDEVANSTRWLLEMQRKGSLNLSVKLEWLCLQHRQAWSRPQSPVKWESVETGQGWMLQWSSSVDRTYRECERPGSAEGGGQNQPVCTSTVLWELVSSITTRPAKLTYPRN